MPSVRSYPSLTGICGVMSLSRSQASSLPVPYAVSAQRAVRALSRRSFRFDRSSSCLLQPRHRCALAGIDIDDDGVLDIDHVVEPIAKLNPLVRLRGPGRAWVTRRDRLRQLAMDAGLVRGEGFAIDASVMEANASRYQGKPPGEIDWSLPERQTRAAAEFLGGLEDEDPEANRGPTP